MKTTLVLSDIPVLVSDETIYENNWYLSTDYKILLFTGKYSLGDRLPKECRRIIAGVAGLPAIDYKSSTFSYNGHMVEFKKQDKIFTIDDMRIAIKIGMEIQQGLHGDKLITDIIQSLIPKPIEIPVMVEMECGDLKQCECESDERCLVPVPKVTNSRIKIIKVLN